MKIPRWAWVVWILAFVVLEGIALFDGVMNDTLTESLHHSVPGWLVFMFLGWLVYHFLLTYIGGKRDGR
jgi:uncharacterized membrane protein YbhN (UPF0104 family)